MTRPCPRRRPASFSRSPKCASGSRRPRRLTSSSRYGGTPVRPATARARWLAAAVWKAGLEVIDHDTPPAQANQADPGMADVHASVPNETARRRYMSPSDRMPETTWYVATSWRIESSGISTTLRMMTASPASIRRYLGVRGLSRSTPTTTPRATMARPRRRAVRSRRPLTMWCRCVGPASQFPASDANHFVTRSLIYERPSASDIVCLGRAVRLRACRASGPLTSARSAETVKAESLVLVAQPIL